MKKVLWEEMQRPEIEEAAQSNAVVIIPTGSMEQHGNHLPVNTDTNTCFSIAKRAAELIEEFPVLVAPPLWLGFSPMNMKYAGTISLKLQTYIDVLSEVAICIAAHGFKKIFFLNGHAGNSGAISSMRWKLMDEDKMTSCIGYSYYKLIDEELQSASEADFYIGHAGEIETSLQLYLYPELVDKKAISWSPGVLGDPTKSTSEKGKRLFEAATKAVAAMIRDYHSGKLESALEWTPHGISPDLKKYVQF